MICLCFFRRCVSFGADHYLLSAIVQGIPFPFCGISFNSRQNPFSFFVVSPSTIEIIPSPFLWYLLQLQKESLLLCGISFNSERIPFFFLVVYPSTQKESLLLFVVSPSTPERIPSPFCGIAFNSRKNQSSFLLYILQLRRKNPFSFLLYILQLQKESLLLQPPFCGIAFNSTERIPSPFCCISFNSSKNPFLLFVSPSTPERSPFSFLV
ncbi:hypothetical protein CEXT_186931 [Caerostris extrusa]|uniref:Uncharacterized protein n=1 Tax=Caerostris extrusa TaxID=172846 RepID=A0AAV4VUT5_CAEEX|nr:hypothetical protein CEXT_186931 [Caerostris extrusa]